MNVAGSKYLTVPQAEFEAHERMFLNIGPFSYIFGNPDPTVIKKYGNVYSSFAMQTDNEEIFEEDGEQEGSQYNNDKISDNSTVSEADFEANESISDDFDTFPDNAQDLDPIILEEYADIFGSSSKQPKIEETSQDRVDKKELQTHRAAGATSLTVSLADFEAYERNFCNIDIFSYLNGDPDAKMLKEYANRFSSIDKQPQWENASQEESTQNEIPSAAGPKSSTVSKADWVETRKTSDKENRNIVEKHSKKKSQEGGKHTRSHSHKTESQYNKAKPQSRKAALRARKAAKRARKAAKRARKAAKRVSKPKRSHKKVYNSVDPLYYLDVNPDEIAKTSQEGGMQNECQPPKAAGYQKSEVLEPRDKVRKRLFIDDDESYQLGGNPSTVTKQPKVEKISQDSHKQKGSQSSKTVRSKSSKVKKSHIKASKNMFNNADTLSYTVENRDTMRSYACTGSISPIAKQADIRKTSHNIKKKTKFQPSASRAANEVHNTDSSPYCNGAIDTISYACTDTFSPIVIQPQHEKIPPIVKRSKIEEPLDLCRWPDDTLDHRMWEHEVLYESKWVDGTLDEPLERKMWADEPLDQTLEQSKCTDVTQDSRMRADEPLEQTLDESKWTDVTQDRRMWAHEALDESKWVDETLDRRMWTDKTMEQSKCTDVTQDRRMWTDEPLERKIWADEPLDQTLDESKWTDVTQDRRMWADEPLDQTLNQSKWTDVTQDSRMWADEPLERKVWADEPLNSKIWADKTLDREMWPYDSMSCIDYQDLDNDSEYENPDSPPSPEYEPIHMWGEIDKTIPFLND